MCLQTNEMELLVYMTCIIMILYTGVQKFLYTIEMIDFFNTKHLLSRQQTNWSR